MTTIERLVASAIALGLAVVAIDPIITTGAQLVDKAETLREWSQGHQQEIQDLVCEAGGTPKADCPVIILPESVTP